MKKPARPKKCKHCGEMFQPFNSIEKMCSTACILAGLAGMKKKDIGRAERSRKKAKTAKSKELRTRLDWYSRLGTLVNQYVRWRDRDEPCCTCGTTNPNIKYDAGHFHTKKARPDIRFELTNIHRQCSQRCNVYGSGMRNEYEKFIADKYGPEHVDWLAEQKRPLFEVFPNWQDIEAEIKRYRKLLREVGVKPNI